ncbi:MAG: hypothetical protein CVV44_10025 [Spirochaetae bacterium HGW-Spirochaetae-1]|jgi:methyl-accepting chemotaxis protein|nr:MAG: hypothetical protein CVV44_10025 [Spirochaetae bacterium HGW-Spirochaetae-1]
MNVLATERIINRTRYIFAIFFIVLAISSLRSGSEKAIYLSILIGGVIHLSVAIVNQVYIALKKTPMALIYISVTIEVMILFFVKFSFHYDAFNGWALTVKESATFILYILYVIIHSLRFNGRLNIYMGIITITSYIILIAMGIAWGGMSFVTDSKLIFEPGALRIPTELAKILFMMGNTYFVYLMANFTTNNVRLIENARQTASDNLERTNTLLSNVRDVASTLASSMEEMSATTLSLAENTQSQTAMEDEIMTASTINDSSIDELAANADTQSVSFKTLTGKMNELSHSIEDLNQETADALKQTRSIAERVADGEKALQTTNEIMRAIENSSSEMTNIMGLINDISDQVNLLSLNASIESARAGDAGRGFAVVADEISKLADRTAHSIKDIGQIIQTNKTDIQKGLESVSYLSDIIKLIINDIGGIGSLMQRISEFMNLQIKYNNDVAAESESMRYISEKIDESLETHRASTMNISDAIKKISKVGQENSSAAEEMAANTEEIASVAERLNRLVDSFEFTI